MSTDLLTPAKPVTQPKPPTYEEILAEADRAEAAYRVSQREIHTTFLEMRNLVADTLANMQAAKDHLLSGCEGIRP